MADADLDQDVELDDPDDTELPLTSGRTVTLGKYAGILPAGTVITVASAKGGVGKSQLARELAWLLNAVLLDLEWEKGSSTKMWGYDSSKRKPTSNQLVMALMNGGLPVPRPLNGVRNLKADLIPGHRALSAMPTLKYEDVSRWIRDWAKQLGRVFVVDTHPGGSPITLGAMAAADLVFSPITLEQTPLEGLEGMLEEHAKRDYNILVVPNMWPNSPSERLLNWLVEMTAAANVPLSPFIGDYRFVKERRKRMAISAADPTPALHCEFVDQLDLVMERVIYLAS